MRIQKAEAIGQNPLRFAVTISLGRKKGNLNCHCCSGPVKKSGHFKNRNGVAQRYVCTRCGKYSSDSQPVEGLRLENANVIQIVKLLAEGLGVRSSARVIGCDPHTVLSVLETIGPECEALHNRLVQNVKTDALQIDELWAKVCCFQKKALGADEGDQYTFLAIAAREKFIVSFHTCKRDNENTEAFVRDVAGRVKERVQITTDAFQPYQPQSAVISWGGWIMPLW